MRVSWSNLIAPVLVTVGLLGGCSMALGQIQPGDEIDQKEVCLGCHDLGDALDAKYPHAPVESGDCTACHNPHAARHGALLRDRPGPLCATCHSDVQHQAGRSVVHPPVAEGRCAACHQPHGSPHQGLLVEQSTDLCASCHDELGSWKERPVQHRPFAQGRCSACHDPHSSAAPGLLDEGGSGICLRCHQTDSSFSAAHQGYPVQRAACHQCHEPHASAQRGLFRESVHAPFESGDCRSCHPGPGSRNPFAILRPMDELCGDCHQATIDESRTASFPHVSAGGGDCVTCHNAHTGDGTGLLRREPQALCTECHNPGGARSGDEGRHLTHQDFECMRCHQPHGAEQPLLFAADSVELCGGCHTHEHGVRHPLGEETRDPRTGNPMTCLSCHGLHRSDGEMYLFEADLRMLCVGCHKDLVGR
jgi:predicted CXXCH cytochrome family protein